MKTRHFLTALALPALFAACTADEFESTNFDQAQSQRPLLSEDFRLRVGEDVNTRYAVEGDNSLNFKWEDGDLYGAAIIDNYKPNVTPDQWDIIYSLAGNTPFKYNAATDEWTATARTGIGHYLFVYPYNADDNTRGAVGYTLPTVQELYGADGKINLNAAVEKGNKAVSAALLTGEEDGMTISLKNLYSYPKFRVNFDNGLPITSVSQVVLEYQDGFIVKGGFNHSKVWTLFNGEEQAEVIGEGKRYKTAKEYWDAQQTEDFIITKTDKDEGGASLNERYTQIETSNYIVAKFPENTKVSVDGVTNNKYIDVRFMIPGELITDDAGYDQDGKFNMHIYTNNGVYTINNVNKAIEFKNETSADLKARVFARNASYTLNLNKANVTKGEELYIVTNVKDWNDLVSKYDVANKTVSVAVVGEEFTLDASAKMPSKATFKVTTNITVKGNVTMSNVKVEGAELKVKVEKDATLTTGAGFEATTIENKGIVNIAPVKKDGKVIEYDLISEIENDGTVNVLADAKATFALTNKINANTLAHGVFVNNGVATVDLTNYGEVTNEGTLNLEGNNEQKQIVANSTPEKAFTPVITNNKKVLATGVFNNKGKFLNSKGADVACREGEGTFANTGFAEVKDGSSFLITSNTGEVMIEKVAQAGYSVPTNSGFISCAPTEAKLKMSSYKAINKLYVSGNFELEDCGMVKDVEVAFETSGKLTLPKYDGSTTEKAEYTAIDNLTVKSGTCSIASAGAKLNKLTVEEGAKALIDQNNTVEATALEVEKDATVLVGGTFKTETQQSAIEGSVESTGAGSSITFGKTDVDTAKAKYEAEVKRMVEAVILSKTTWTEVESIATFDWTTGNSALTGTPAFSDLLNGAFTAYNNWMEAAGEEGYQDVDAYKAAEVKNEAEFKAAIDAYKTAGNNGRGEAIKAEIKKNTDWINTEVYQKQTAGAKLIEIATVPDGGEDPVTMVSAFAIKVKTITAESVNVVKVPTGATATNAEKDAANATNKAIFLSLQAVQGTDAEGVDKANFVQASWIPAYSYIETYAEADAYKVMKALTSFDAKWYNTTGEDSGKAFVFETLAEVKQAIALINDKYNMTGAEALGTLEKYKIEESGILNYVKTVLGWEYTDGQITALKEIVDPSQNG